MEIKKTFSYHAEISVFGESHGFMDEMHRRARTPEAQRFRESMKRVGSRPRTFAELGFDPSHAANGCTINAGEFAVTSSKDGIYSSGLSQCCGSFFFDRSSETVAFGHHFEGLPQPERELREIAEMFGISRSVTVTLVGAWDQSVGYLPMKLHEEAKRLGLKLVLDRCYIFRPGIKDLYISRASGEVFMR